MFASFLLGFLAEVQNKNVSVIIINQCEHLTIQLQVAQVFIDCHVVFKTFFKNFSKRLNEKMI